MNKLSLFFSIFVILLHSFSQQINSEELERRVENDKGDALNLPGKTSIQLNPEVIVSMFDGMTVKTLFLRSNTIQFKTVPMSNWQSLQSKKNNYSICFTNRHNTDLRIGMSVYSKSEFPWALDEQTIFGLLLGYKNKFSKKGIEFLPMPKGFRPNGHLGYLFGPPSYLTDFKFYQKNKKEIALRKISYYLTVHSLTVIVTLEGPAELVEQNKATIEYFVQRLSVVSSE